MNKGEFHFWDNLLLVVADHLTHHLWHPLLSTALKAVIVNQIRK